MPIFEYRCNACGERFELLVRHSSPEARCPVCESHDLEKLISAVTVSSEHTQKRALESGKKKVASQKYDYQYEQHKEYHEHDSEHD